MAKIKNIVLNNDSYEIGGEPYGLVNISVDGWTSDMNVTVTITPEGVDAPVYSELYNGNVISLKLLTTFVYKVTFSGEVKFSITEITVIATPFQIQNVSTTVQPFGVSILDSNGKIYKVSEWNTANNANVSGIAVISAQHSFVIHPNSLGSMKINNGATSGYGTTASPDTSDYNGIENTQYLINNCSGGNYAPGACTNVTFAHGKQGYLPAIGELAMISTNISSINTALTRVGGSQIELYDHWSSTRYMSINEDPINQFVGAYNFAYNTASWVLSGNSKIIRVVAQL